MNQNLLTKDDSNAIILWHLTENSFEGDYASFRGFSPNYDRLRRRK